MPVTLYGLEKNRYGWNEWNREDSGESIKKDIQLSQINIIIGLIMEKQVAAWPVNQRIPTIYRYIAPWC